MLPGVNAEQRSQIARDGVLVCASDDRELAGSAVLGEPSPATALDASQSRVELLLEGVKGAKLVADGRLKVFSQLCGPL